MKKFLKKLILVIFLFFLGLIFFVFSVHLIVKKKANFSLDKNIKYVVLGHSHPECAFNDGLIKHLKNLANSGESYFYNFQKIREIFNFSKPNVIFIEYTNNVIEPVMNDWIWGYEKMNAYFPTHSPFMSKTDITYLLNKNMLGLSKVISTSTRSNFVRIIMNKYLYTKDSKYGSYNYLIRNNITRLKKNMEKNKKEYTNLEEISYENIKFLKKIVNYCKKNNVKIYFVRSPQYKLYDRENEKKLIEIKNKYFPEIQFLDFDRFPLSDEEYADFEHLNYKGAKTFSIWFNNLLENGMLDKKDVEKYIKHQISIIRNLKSLD